MKKQQPGEFEKAASAQSHRGFLNELWSFLKTNKKWWLLPIIIVFFNFRAFNFPVGHRLGAIHLHPVLNSWPHLPGFQQL